MVAHVVEVDSWSMPLSSRLALPSTLAVDYNYTLGDLGYRSQWADVSTTSSFTGGVPGIVPIRDIFWNIILRRCLWDFGIYDARFALGLTRVDHRKVRRLDTYIKTQKYKGRLDIFPSNLLSSLAGVINPPRNSRRVNRDKFVVHYNAEGVFRKQQRHPIPVKVYNGISEDIVVPLFDPVQDPQWVGISFFPSLKGTSYPFDVGACDFHTRTSTAFTPGPLLETLEILRDNPSEANSHHYPSGTEEHYSELNYLRFTVLPDGVDITYEYTAGYKRSIPFREWRHRWRVHIRFELTKTGQMSLDPLSGSYQDVVALSPTIISDFALVSGFYSNYEATEDEVITTAFHPYRRDFNPIYWADVVLIMNLPTLPSDARDAYSDADAMVRAHGSYWRGRHYMLQTSSVYAFHDGIKSPMEVAQISGIETLAEIESWGDILPEFSVLMEAIRAFRKGRLDALLKFGDFVASSYLLYHFGIKPNAETVAELNARGPRLAELTAQGFKTTVATSHGQFQYPFADDETIYQGAHLLTRIATDFEYSDSSFFKAIASLYGWGVAPLPSNFYQAFKLSFVLDWFTNMQSRLEAVDISLISFMMAIYASTVSFTVTTPGSSDTFKKTSFDRGVFSLVYYARDVTRVVPHLVDGGVDFMRVTRSPNFGIFSSLLYVLSRGRIKSSKG